MAKHGKRFRAALSLIDRSKRYPLDEAIRLAVDTAKAKFDETVEIAVRRGVNPRQADHNVRGTFILQHGMRLSVCVHVSPKVGTPIRLIRRTASTATRRG